MTAKGPGATPGLPRKSHGVAADDPDPELPPPPVLSQVPTATSGIAAEVSGFLCVPPALSRTCSCRQGPLGL